MVRVVRESTVVDHKTGEVYSEEKVVQFPTEPAYVKLYLDDLGALLQLPGKTSALLHALVRGMDYDGCITLSTKKREIICDQVGLKRNSLCNSIAALVKSGILVKETRSDYVVNPAYFARGKWSDIVRKRRNFSMKVEYSADGSRVITTD